MEKPPEWLISELLNKLENHFVNGFDIAHKIQSSGRFECPHKSWALVEMLAFGGIGFYKNLKYLRDKLGNLYVCLFILCCVCSVLYLSNN